MTSDIHSNNEQYYNHESKLFFISNSGSGVSKIYSRLFRLSYPFEQLHQKDLYDFNIGQLNEFFASLNPSTKKSAESYIEYISRYILWSVDNFLRLSPNPLK